MKFKSKKTMSASDLMAQLQSDKKFVQESEERQTDREALERQLKLEEQPLLAELANAGIHIASVWDLVNAKWSYAGAIPVLIRHLPLQYPPKIREGICRALTVREARGIAGRPILEELKRQDEKPHAVRWSFANALTEAADFSMVDDIKTLAEDDRFKDVRKILEIALKNIAARRREGRL